MSRWSQWFKSSANVKSRDEFDRARALVDAIDRGGLPLMPSKINDIARDLGLEVSRKAPMAETIERIRAAVARHKHQDGHSD
jgi:hypothetical protein